MLLVQVRELVAAAGLEVWKLTRVRVGGYTLPRDLKLGSYRWGACCKHTAEAYCCTIITAASILLKCRCTATLKLGSYR
jgi:hypothetical protein